MLFASDLDRTLIYSKRFLQDSIQGLICVERGLEGKPLSYMSEDAYIKLENLISNIQFVPVTTRSLKQFKRLWLSEKIEYAIIDNGGTILHNGEPFSAWEEFINPLLEPNRKQFQKLVDLINTTQEDLIQEAKVIDNCYIMAKVSHTKACKTLLNSVLDTSLWYYKILWNKLYVLPKCVSKEFALEFLVKYLGEKDTVSAGDGALDIGMLNFTTHAIIPEHGKVYTDNLLKREYKLVSYGISASSEILDHVSYLENGGD